MQKKGVRDAANRERANIPMGDLWLSERHWSLGGGDYCQAGRSPLIWKDRLVADLGDWVRAFDTTTGRQIWAVNRKEKKISQHEMESPVVVTVAGKDYLFCNSYPPITVRLEDGVVCPIAGIKSPGIIVRGNPDQRDMLFMSGGGEHGGWENKGRADILPPAAIRLSPGEGDGLKAEVLWHGVNGAMYGSQLTPMICSKNRLYFGELILDALTGKILSGRPRSRNTPEQAVPGSTLTLAIAGGRIYGQGYAEHGSEKRKDDLGALVESEVYDLDGHRLAVNHLRGLPGQEAMRIRNNIPNWFNYPNNFTIIGDRILTRSCYEVICIGNTAKPFDEVERSKIAPKLAGNVGLDVVLSHLESPDRHVRLAAIQSLGTLGNAAASACPKLLTMLQSDQAAKSETGFLALCALGPDAKSVAPDLVKLSIGIVPGKDVMWKDGTQPLTGIPLGIERARTILAGMGAAAVEAILPLLNDEAGFTTAMQIAAMMPDYDAAVQIFAKGMIEGKAPFSMPRLPPFVRYPEVTKRDVLPEALNSRAWKTKAGTQILMKDLPADPKSREYKQAIASIFPIVVAADPTLLVPHLETLRAMVKERGNHDIIEVLGRMQWH